MLSSFQWDLHIKSYILHTHTHLLLLAKSGLAYTAQSYFLSPIILLLLSVFFLIQSLCLSCQHKTSYIPIFPNTALASMVPHIYTHPLLHPQHSP